MNIAKSYKRPFFYEQIKIGDKLKVIGRHNPVLGVAADDDQVFTVTRIIPCEIMEDNSVCTVRQSKDTPCPLGGNDVYGKGGSYEQEVTLCFYRFADPDTGIEYRPLGGNKK